MLSQIFKDVCKILRGHCMRHTLYISIYWHIWRHSVSFKKKKSYLIQKIPSKHLRSNVKHALTCSSQWNSLKIECLFLPVTQVMKWGNEKGSKVTSKSWTEFHFATICHHPYHHRFVMLLFIFANFFIDYQNSGCTWYALGNQISFSESWD